MTLPFGILSLSQLQSHVVLTWLFSEFWLCMHLYIYITFMQMFKSTISLLKFSITNLQDGQNKENYIGTSIFI